MRRFSTLILCAVASLSLLTRAADNKPKAEELFPGSTLVSVIIPDLSDARASAAKTRLADMYAQPEMQAFLAPALAQLKTSYLELRAKNPILPALADLDAGLFAGEVGAAVYARPNDPNLPFGIAAAISPKDPEAFRRLLPEKIRELLTEGQVVPVGRPPREASVVFIGGRLLACAPSDDIGGLLGKLKNDALRKDSLAATPGFTAVRGKLANSAGVLYVAPKNLIDMGLKIAHATQRHFDPFAAQTLLNATGIANVSGFGFGIGFSQTDPICESYIGFTAPPKDDLFTLFHGDAPISAEGMKIAAEDAPYVAGAYFNSAALLPFLKRLAGAAGPEAVNGFDLALGMGQQVFGFDIQKDFLENLGGEMVVAQTAFDTGAPLSFMPGLIVSIPAKNPAKIESCIAKFGDAVASASTLATQGAMGLKLKRIDHHGKTVFYLSGQVLAGPVTLCVMNGRLLIGTSFNAVCRGIDQLEKNTDILSNKIFQETIARIAGKFDPKALPASFAYSIDKGSGTGALVLTTMGLFGGTAAIGGVAEIPTLPGQNAGGVGDLAKNETSALQSCMAYAEAQEIYHRTDYQNKGVLQYAQALKGDNSLLETRAGNGDIALIDKSMADADGEPGGARNKNGYRFKILKGQGENATGGKRDYLVNGNMTLGYALIAYPAEYGVSGKRSFMISNNGTIYARDLGAATADVVSKTTLFDPDKSWIVTEAPRPEAEPTLFGGGNDFEKFIARPSGKAVMAIAGTIDLGLWPDEGFFMKYRRPIASYGVVTPDGIYWRSELPPPGPASTGGINPMMVVSGTAIIAAIAVPSLLRSRLAANETAAAACCKAFAEAEEIYHRTDYTGNGVLKYAQSLKDLYETKEGQGDLALIDRTFRFAEAGAPNATPKAGYYFKVLTAQGPAATGGKRNYVVNGNMTLGYALVAYPAQYDSTGRDTFIINGNGTIFQKDLGAETKDIVEKMTEFNPDQTWVPTE
jgi:hypothetical protein